MIYDSIIKCDVDIRKEFFNNITLAGGSACFKGFYDRLKDELYKVVANYYDEVKIRNSVDLINSSWIGGSILSSLSTFDSMWIKKT